MMYIDLATHFWQIVDGRQLPTGVTALYFYLLNEANRTRWDANNLTIKTADITRALGISRKELTSLRNILQTLGLIDYIPGRAKRPCRYRVLHATLRSGEIVQPFGELDAPTTHSHDPDSNVSVGNIKETLREHYGNINASDTYLYNNRYIDIRYKGAEKILGNEKSKNQNQRGVAGARGRTDREQRSRGYQEMLGALYGGSAEMAAGSD